MTIMNRWMTMGGALACGMALAGTAGTAQASTPRACNVPAHGACAPSSLTHDSQPPRSENPQVLFLNFDDVTLEVGDDDAPNNTTIWEDLAGTWTGYPEWTPQMREEARERVATVFAPFDVLVTVTRPESGDYTMVVVGEHGDFSGGYSTSDCDNMNPNTVAFVAARPEGQADYNLIAHEAGHSFGLTHTDTEPNEIMNPVVWEDSELGTQCVPRSSDYCDEFLLPHCPQGEQNSHATLCGTLGSWDTGEECDLEAEPQPDPNEPDDGGTGTDTGDDGEPGGDESTEGDEGPAADESAGGGDDALPGGTGDTGDTGDTGGSSPEENGGEDDGGCGCTTGPSRPGSMLFGLAVLVGIRWRRRAKPSITASEDYRCSTTRS